VAAVAAGNTAVAVAVAVAAVGVAIGTKPNIFLVTQCPD
jgi:hypothetical protein